MALLTPRTITITDAISETEVTGFLDVEGRAPGSESSCTRGWRMRQVLAAVAVVVCVSACGATAMHYHQRASVGELRERSEGDEDRQGHINGKLFLAEDHEEKAHPADIEAKHQHSNVDTFAEAASLSEQMPYSMQLFTCLLTKPLVTVVLFGPLCEGKKTTQGKILQMVCLLLVCFQVVTDLVRVAHCWNSELTRSEFFHAVMVVFSTSSNIASFTSLMALLTIFQTIATYKELTKDSKQRTEDAAPKPKPKPFWEWLNENLDEILGPVGKVYCVVLLLGMAFPMLAVTIYILPVVIIYAYIPAIIACVSYVVGEIAWNIISTCKVNGKEPDEPLPNRTDANVKDLALALGLREEGKERKIEKLKKEVKTLDKQMLLTGCTQAAWKKYFALAAFMSMVIGFMVPVAARLYSGRGYVHALFQTCNDRNGTYYFGQIANMLYENFWLKFSAALV